MFCCSFSHLLLLHYNVYGIIACILFYTGYAVYQKLKNEVLQKLPPPSHVVYLSAPAEVCRQRTIIRGRVSGHVHKGYARGVSVSDYYRIRQII